MALRLSTGLRNKMLGLVATVRGAVQGINLAFVDGGAGSDTITDSGNGFLTAGFAPGDVLFVRGATTAGNDSAITGAVLTGVTAGVLTFATAIVAAAEAGVAKTIVACARGGALKDVFKDGVLRIYSSSQATTADTAKTGTLLLEITVGAAAFVHGAFANGLEFGDAADGAIAKATAETWQAVGLASGTAQSFRFVANPTDDATLSTTQPRIEGSVGTSGADLNMSSTTITVGATYTIDAFVLTLPMQYGS
jgi:hypothetical protein